MSDPLTPEKRKRVSVRVVFMAPGECVRRIRAAPDGEALQMLAFMESAAEQRGREEMAEENARLRADLNKLRALVAQSKMPCIYCGVEAGGVCPAGYPGCGRMDDLMLDSEFVARLCRDMEAHENTGEGK